MRRSIAALALAMVLPTGVLMAPAARADVIVKPGETLSEIADRHGVSLERLMQANGIRNPNLVVAGTRLVLPGSRSGGGGAGSGGTVTVRPGETLSEIADRNGVSLKRLMQANGISDPAFVEAGRRLVIPGKRSTVAAASSAEPSRPTGYYTVKNGETLSEIADRNQTSVDRLMQLNGISNPNLVVAGTRLSVPMRSRPAAAQVTTSRGKASHHVVQEGETLSHIAADYNVPVDRLISLNKISDPNRVVVGTRLTLQAPPPVKAKVKVVASKPKPAAAAVASKTASKPRPAAPAVASTPASKPAAAPAVASKPAVIQPIAKASPSTTDVVPATTAAKPATTTAPATATTPTPVKTSAAQPMVAKATSTSTATTAPTTAAPAASATAPVTATATKTATASATPTTKPAAQAAAPTVRRSPRPATTVARAKTTGPDWRSYGPMQVDWANWRAMGGSFVAPSLGSDGKPQYLAINCGARKLNATSQSGQWRTWDSPQNDYEQKLVSDLCTSKGG